MKPSDSSNKSITPQRKHRKLMKDGSGTEVWPEDIEKIFVQGLRDYWDSPYATYSQSRGRSRWRNQFLVDHLQKSGITRSKKQVASHIQVLRNMWKGEPEFYLVAGGDELLSEADQSSVKVEDQWDGNSLIAFDHEEADAPFSSSASPDYSPPDFQANFPPTPEQFPNMRTLDTGSTRSWHPKSQYSPSHISPPLSQSYETNSGIHMPMNNISSHGKLARQPDFHSAHPRSSLEKVSARNSPNVIQGTPPSISTFQDIHWNETSPVYQQLPRGNSASYQHTPFSSNNRITTFCLSADGMTPFSVKMDALVPPPISSLSVGPFTLKMKLSIAAINDPRGPSTLHGFNGSLCLANVWSLSGKCITRVYTGNACVSEEIGTLDITHINVGTVNALLPESFLSRCRWLDANIPSVITQEIIVDDETLLYVIYDLERRGGSSLPSAELCGFQKFRPVDKTLMLHQQNLLQSHSLYGASGFIQMHGKQSPQTTLSSALTPARYATQSPMS